MAWELQIWRAAAAAAAAATETASVPLGDLEKITSEIELYFPEITWVTSMNGVWETDAGSVEFDIRGRPVHLVALRVHNADPSLQLIALARANGWIVTNDSTGANLESETEVSSDAIDHLQGKAAFERMKLNGQSAAPTSKMPRIKSRTLLSQVESDSKLRFLEIIELRDDEVTMDLLFEYGHAVRNAPSIRPLKFQPIFGTEEILLPDGRRFAVAHFSRKIPQVNEFYDNYWTQEKRSIGKYLDHTFVLSDGTIIADSQCTWIVRATGMSRNRSNEE